mmetsp:Transcript_4927/g.17875  ORF Transcript_4927/g.17875 Transcript_4927/m.17875 type:complete len:202 (+) Transcript_4927:1538-2143(+)
MFVSVSITSSRAHCAVLASHEACICFAASCAKKSGSACALSASLSNNRRMFVDRARMWSNCDRVYDKPLAKSTMNAIATSNCAKFVCTCWKIARNTSSLCAPERTDSMALDAVWDAISRISTSSSSMSISIHRQRSTASVPVASSSTLSPWTKSKSLLELNAWTAAFRFSDDADGSHPSSIMCTNPFRRPELTVSTASIRS